MPKPLPPITRPAALLPGHEDLPADGLSDLPWSLLDRIDMTAPGTSSPGYDAWLVAAWFNVDAYRNVGQ